MAIATPSTVVSRMPTTTYIRVLTMLSRMVASLNNRR